MTIDDLHGPRYAPVSPPSPSMTDGDLADLLALKRRLDLEQSRLDAALLDGVRAAHAERIRRGEPEVMGAVLVRSPMIDVGDLSLFGGEDRPRTEPAPLATSTLFVAPEILAAFPVRPATGADRLYALPWVVRESAALPMVLPPPAVLSDDEGER